LAFAVFALLSASPALAQYAEAIEACRGDATRFCGDASRDGDRLAECIKAHFQDLNKPCQAALVETAAVRKSCRADIQEQCRGKRPGAGRILLCVKAHFAALSEPCKDAIGHAAQRRVRSLQAAPRAALNRFRRDE
jgi:hypothetical protein